MGRFISPDSVVPEPGSSGGFNRYRYTRNNPLKYTDPSGHCGIRFGGGNSAVMQRECIDVGGGGAGPAIIVGATVGLAVVGREVGLAVGEALADSIHLNENKVEPPPGYGEGELEFNDPYYQPGPELGGEFLGPLNLPGPSLDVPGLNIGGFELGQVEIPTILKSRQNRQRGVDYEQGKLNKKPRNYNRPPLKISGPPQTAPGQNVGEDIKPPTTAEASGAAVQQFVDEPNIKNFVKLVGAVANASVRVLTGGN